MTIEPATPSRKLATPEEIADYLGVPLGTVYQWSSRGGGPQLIKVGRHLRARWEDIEAWLGENAKGDRLLHSTEEVADLLSIGLTTAKALITSGELRSVKIGRARRVPAEALHEYVRHLQDDQGADLSGGRQ